MNYHDTILLDTHRVAFHRRVNPGNVRYVSIQLSLTVIPWRHETLSASVTESLSPAVRCLSPKARATSLLPSTVGATPALLPPFCGCGFPFVVVRGVVQPPHKREVPRRSASAVLHDSACCFKEGASSLSEQASIELA
jgi:hypothetical protein